MKTDYRPPDRNKYLMEDEIIQLLSAAENVLNERDYLMLYFSANSGVRPSELLVLENSDFRWDESMVRVRTLKQKKDKRTGKARVIYRDVDLAESCINKLQSWCEPITGQLWPYSRQWAWRLFKTAAEAAGLRDSYSMYSLRHSRCIYLLNVTNQDYKYVQYQMGHSDVNVTMAYVHVLPEVREKYRSEMRGIG